MYTQIPAVGLFDTDRQPSRQTMASAAAHSRQEFPPFENRANRAAWVRESSFGPILKRSWLETGGLVTYSCRCYQWSRDD